MERLSMAQIVGLVTIAVIIGVIAMLFGSVTTNKKDEPHYITYKKQTPINMTLNGEYLVYSDLGEEYEEKGVVASLKGKDITDDVIITYFQNDREVSTIDGSEAGTFLVKYTVMYNDKIKTISRTVIVSDTTSPTISVPEKQVITSVQAASFDLENGVIASDNSGEVELTYDNTLSTIAGDYVITYKAKDASGNETIRKRLIKVISGIDFTYTDGEMEVKFPPSPNKSKYTYKYSLDGGDTWVTAEYQTQIQMSSGDIIASVYENDKYVMSNSYTIK